MAKRKTPQLVDHVDESSDEEIDEDLAFNSDDERMYGDLFKPKKSSSKRKRAQQQKGGEDFDSDESSIDDDDDNSGDDGGGDEEEEEESGESDDGIASDDDDDDGDGGQFMLDLLNNLDKKETDAQKEVEDMRALMAHSSKVPESEFAVAAGAAKSGSSTNSNSNSTTLTLDQLMSGITDTKGFKAVKNVMKDMTSEIYENDVSSTLSTTKTPVAKIVSERAERKVHYAEQSKNVSGWTQVVKQNREAETLDFRPKDRIRINKADLVQKFEPTTDFEKEIAAALEEAGAADEKEIMRREEEAMFGKEGGEFDDDDDDDDDLGRNKLSEEEYKKRLGQLKRMRALMFYEEQKRHHMNKIKSKKYRKIRKKQRLRSKEEEEKEAAENDQEIARQLEEKAEMERMQERMSLKHRNTSKWAKRVLRRGGNVDTETRKALSEQIRIGDELKKKMEGQFGDSDDDDETDLVSQARNILAQTENDDTTAKNTGIFKLAFMKKGIEAQRQIAIDEAKELLQELEANESEEESDSKSGEGEDEVVSKPSPKKKTASAKEMKNILAEGKLVASSLKFGNSNSVQVSGDIDIGMNEVPTESESNSAENSTKTISLTTVDTATTSEKSEPPANVTKSKATAAKQVATTTSTTKNNNKEESNPWLLPDPNEKKTAESSGGSKKKKQKSGPSVSKRGIVNVADAVNIISGNVNDNGTDEDVEKTTSVEKDSGKIDANVKIASLSQEELVRKAFATPSEKDIEEEFNKEKEQMKNRDDHSKKAEESKFVSGWGSWAGEGVPVARPPKKKLPKRLAPPEKKKIERRKRKDDGKKNVIINAKRIKKTAKFQLENIPYPFTSREQYEKAMGGAIGKEWNVTTAVKNMTRSEVITKAGKIIKPISKKAKMKRAPAKF